MRRNGNKSQDTIDLGRRDHATQVRGLCDFSLIFYPGANVIMDRSRVLSVDGGGNDLGVQCEPLRHPFTIYWGG
jgi:hypothetical protein